MRDRRRQIDMAHALAPDLRLDYLDPALLAHHAAMAHALVLAAITFVVLGRTENLGAKQPVALRLEGAVVDGLGLLYLAVRPRADHLGRRDRNPDRVERDRILGLFEQAEQVFHNAMLPGARRPLVPCRRHTRSRELSAPVTPGRNAASLSLSSTDTHRAAPPHALRPPALRRPRSAIQLNPGASTTASGAALRLLQQFDIEAERLQLLDHHVKRLRQPRLERILALDDRLVHPRAAGDVV